MKRYLALVVACGMLVALPIIAMQRLTSGPPSIRHGANLPVVSIPLLGPVTDISVTGLPSDEVEQFLRSGDLLKPHALKIRMPDGRSITVKVRSMSFGCDMHDHRSIRYLYVRRPIHPARFQEVVTDLQHTVREMGAEPSGSMLEMSKWGDLPGWEKGGGVVPYEHKTGFSLGARVNASVSIKPDLGGGWFYLMSIGVEQETHPSTNAISVGQEARQAATQSIPVKPTTASSAKSRTEKGTGG